MKREGIVLTMVSIIAANVRLRRGFEGGVEK